MSILLDNDFVCISLKNNIINIKIKNKIPTEENLNSVKVTIQKFYDLVKEKNMKFFHVFNFSDIDITSIPAFISNKEFIKDFFGANYKLFQTNLYCSAIIIDNFIVRNGIKLIFTVYIPSKPIKFVSNEMKAHKFFDLIKEEYKQGKWSFEKTYSEGFQNYDNVYYNKE